MSHILVSPSHSNSRITTTTWCVLLLYVALCGLFISKYQWLGPFGPNIHLPNVPWFGPHETLIVFGPFLILMTCFLHRRQGTAMLAVILTSMFLIFMGTGSRGERLIAQYVPSEVARLTTRENPVYLTISRGRGYSPVGLVRAASSGNGFRIIFPNGIAWTMRDAVQPLGEGWTVSMTASHGILFLNAPDGRYRSLGSVSRAMMDDKRDLALWPVPMPDPSADSPDEVVLKLFKELSNF